MSNKTKFSVNQKVVYPSHGVGVITAIENQTIAGINIEVYVISFLEDKMVLRVPVSSGGSSGLRAVSQKQDADRIFDTLMGKPRQGSKMWSKRAQEYETKINSGDVILLSEVVRDLYRDNNADRSYSERIIYESAIKRLAGEFAASQTISHDKAMEKLISVLKERVAA